MSIPPYDQFFLIVIVIIFCCLEIIAMEKFTSSASTLTRNTCILICDTCKNSRANVNMRQTLQSLNRMCRGKVMMDMHGDHAIHCKSDPGVKFRHDLVRDGLLDIFRRAGVAVKREANVGLSCEELNVALRPADILIYSWLNGKHTCLDITGCSPLVGFNGTGFEKGKVLDLMVRKKYDKHDRACQMAGYEFSPFGFTSFGSLCEEAEALMDRVEKITHQHLTCFKSTRFVFHRLGFFIQKGIAAQLVSRLPVNFVGD